MSRDVRSLSRVSRGLEPRLRLDVLFSACNHMVALWSKELARSRGSLYPQDAVVMFDSHP